jgi:hypothetical protein
MDVVEVADVQAALGVLQEPTGVAARRPAPRPASTVVADTRDL